MGRVVWSAEALSDLEAVHVYIADFKPRAAFKMRARLWSAGNALVDFPERGRLVAGAVRELTTVRPYIIRYRVVSAEEVLIRWVQHGARRR